jgi:outer membrane receptor protein involved in Fe transport
MSKQSILMRRMASSLMAAAAVVVAIPASAQSAAGLDEIVVTARKRAENLQDVALSVSTINAAEIERLNLGNIADIAGLDSSLIFERGYGATDTRITIRGLSPTRGRNNVAVLVDGIDVSSESIAVAGGSLLATSRLVDIERVEIVKGPQSALYGRSAFAGAIQYVTKDPGSEAEGSLRGDYGDYGRYTLSGSISGPVSDSFGLRFNGAYWNEDGIYRNITTGNKLGGGDGWGAAVTGKWQPTESFSVKTRVEYTDDTYEQGVQALMRANVIAPRLASGSTRLNPATGAPSPTGVRVYSPGLTFRGVGTNPGGDDLVVRYSQNPFSGGDFPGSARQLARASIVAAWDFASGTLTSYTGYSDADFTFFQDSDFDAVPVNGQDTALRSSVFDYTNKTRQFSEELRWQSDFDGPVNYALGALYWGEDAQQTARSIDLFCLPAVPAGAFGPGSPPLPPSCGPNNGTQGLRLVDVVPRVQGREITSLSGYGMVEFKFADNWKLTAEARYSDENERVLGVDCALPALPLFPGGPLVPCADATFPGTSVTTPSQVITYDFYSNGGRMRQAPGRPVRLKSTDNFVTPRLTLEVKPTESALYYASVAQGVKPGGISTVTGGGWQDANFDGQYDEFAYKAEKLTEYELGAKTEWLDNRVRLNASLFFFDYKDKQVGTQLVVNNVAIGRLTNAGKAEVKGLELDADWKPSDNWLLHVNYTYLDGEYTDFPISSTSPTDAARFGSCPRSAATQYRLCEINLKGNKLERAPEHSLVLLGRFSLPLAAAFGGGARWYVEADGQIQGERYEDQWNTRKMDDYALFNLRTGIQTERWEALLYVNNLTDDDTILTSSSSPGNVEVALVDPFTFSPADTSSGTLPDPRIIGVRFNYRFGGR